MNNCNRCPEGSDRDFFELCEFSLAEDHPPNAIFSTLRERITFLVVRTFGCWGMIFAYIAMVMRNGSMAIPIFRHVAILDINTNLVLSQTGIRDQCKSLPLTRIHRPSLRIIREIIAAHRRYSQFRSRARHNTAFPSEGAANEVSMRAVTHPWYLYWLLQFYFYRSVGIANSDRLSSEIKAALTIPEFTPSMAGFLSVFFELRIPLTLYLPLKSSVPTLTVKALPFFTTVLAKNGADADFIKAAGFAATYLEPSKAIPTRVSLTSRPKVGFFLASFYPLRDAELAAFVDASMMPIIREVRRQWRPSHLTVFCNPNDRRVAYELLNYGVSIDTFVGGSEGRMSGFDIVVCGNTSVIEEALNHGVPVVYCANLDAYRHDIIGYVKDGIVIDGSWGIPTLTTVAGFYNESVTVARLAVYRDGTLSHPSRSLLEILEVAAGEGEFHMRGTNNNVNQPLFTENHIRKT